MAVGRERKRNLNIMCGLFSLMAALLFAFPGTVSDAKEIEDPSDKEIVMLLDCSKSMEDVDGQYLAFDFLKNLSAVLPRDYHVGMVAFNCSNALCSFTASQRCLYILFTCSSSKSKSKRLSTFSLSVKL